MLKTLLKATYLSFVSVTLWRKGTDCRQEIIPSASLLNCFVLLEQVEVSVAHLSSFLLPINLGPGIISLTKPVPALAMDV